MSVKNELDWEEYEAITKYIYQAMGEKYGIKVIGHGRNCRVRGKSGATYQIDVLTEQTDGGIRRLTAIECKFLKKKVTNDTVMKLWGVMDDAGIERGIIVCKAGFTKDTLLYAQHKGIKLVELREVQENDRDFKKSFETGILDIRLNIMLERANITSIDFGSEIITGKDEIMAMYYTQLHNSQGREIPFSRYISAYSQEMMSRAELLKVATINVPFTGKLFWKHRGTEVSVERIAITGFASRTDQSQERSLVLTDQVWMIMKELFDNRNLTLSKSGLIWNMPQH